MNKCLVLNFKVLKDLDISVDEFLYMYNISQDILIHSDNIDLIKLEREKFIKIITEQGIKKTILRDKSIKLIDFLSIEISNSLENDKQTIKKSDRAIALELGDKVKEFRLKWRGLKPGAMGSLQSCKAKLIRWMKENGEYSFDDILKAADIYIDSLNGDYRYLQRADYFIYKQENNREESSRLSAYVDEIDMVSTDAWTSNLN